MGSLLNLAYTHALCKGVKGRIMLVTHCLGVGLVGGGDHGGCLPIYILESFGSPDKQKVRSQHHVQVDFLLAISSLHPLLSIPSKWKRP